MQVSTNFLTSPQAKGPRVLLKSLHSTNPIESMFSMVRSCERNIKRYEQQNRQRRCYCTANAGSDESRATHPLT